MFTPKREVQKATSRALLSLLFFHCFPIFPTLSKFFLSWCLEIYLVPAGRGTPGERDHGLQCKQRDPLWLHEGHLLFIRHLCFGKLNHTSHGWSQPGSPRPGDKAQECEAGTPLSREQNKMREQSVWIAPRRQGLKKELIRQVGLAEPLLESCFHLI